MAIPLKIIDLQNDFNILVAKQWTIRISVPMSYIKFIIIEPYARIPTGGKSSGGLLLLYIDKHMFEMFC